MQYVLFTEDWFSASRRRYLCGHDPACRLRGGGQVLVFWNVEQDDLKVYFLIL